MAARTSLELSPAALNRDEWMKAGPVRLTRYWSGTEAPPSRHAEARMLWSDRALLVRFVCRQAEPLVVGSHPELTRKTQGLWDRDVCELFIAPGSAVPRRYLEFEAAPTGEWLDLAIRYEEGERRTDWNFNSGMTTAARIDEGSITIAFSIPWTAFEREPRSTERWRANLFRCVGRDPDRGYLAWQPTRTPQPNFHIPEAFGWLHFQDNQ